MSKKIMFTMPVFYHNFISVFNIFWEAPTAEKKYLETPLFLGYFPLLHFECTAFNFTF